MGICDSSETKIIKQSAVLGINPINIYELKNLYSNESAICQIKEGNILKGIGFFCKFEDDLPFEKALFTNYNVLYRKKSTSDNSIEIEYLNQSKKIKLDKRRIVFNNTIGYICIEIFDTDQIKQFFSIDEEIYGNEIFILQYNNEEKLSHSVGVIDDDDKNTIIKYISDTKILYPGAPLIQRDETDETNYVLGIHLKENKELEYNFENFGIPFNIILKDIKDKLNINKYTPKVIKVFEYRNIINLVYEKKSENEFDNNIFGKDFVNNNKKKIRLIINGKESVLTEKYQLKKGINNVKLIITNKLTNLNSMFGNCVSLKNIEELKYLYTEEVSDCEEMFYKCESLTNLNGLENFNLSKCKSFSRMFQYCTSLTDIKAIENWDVSNGTSFCRMFDGCVNLLNIKALRNWDVTNVDNFQFMFCGCSSLREIKALKNWNVSKGNDFCGMFSGCSSLENLKPLINWDVSNVKNFDSMFKGCVKLSNLKGLENWNVSHGTNFSSMFKDCSSIKDLKQLKNWDVSKAETLKFMFMGCSSITNLDSLDKWNVSNVTDFSYLFNGCSSLIDVNALKNWNFLNSNSLRGLFGKCNEDIIVGILFYFTIKATQQLDSVFYPYSSE